MPDLGHLRTPRPPWIALLVKKGAAPLELASASAGLLVRALDGGQCGTKDALLAELARAFEFPRYFGGNWDALEECLTDLDWLSADGYLLVVDRADRLLRTRPEDYAMFVKIARSVGRAWATPLSGVGARPARPFHVLLTVGGAAAASGRDWQIPRLLLRTPPRDAGRR
jgi:hypothetical protein